MLSSIIKWIYWKIIQICHVRSCSKLGKKQTEGSVYELNTFHHDPSSESSFTPTSSFSAARQQNTPDKQICFVLNDQTPFLTPPLVAFTSSSSAMVPQESGVWPFQAIKDAPPLLPDTAVCYSSRSFSTSVLLFSLLVCRFLRCYFVQPPVIVQICSTPWTCLLSDFWLPTLVLLPAFVCQFTLSPCASPSFFFKSSFWSFVYVSLRFVCLCLTAWLSHLLLVDFRWLIELILTHQCLCVCPLLPCVICTRVTVCSRWDLTLNGTIMHHMVLIRSGAE